MMKKKHFYAAVILLLFLAICIQPALGVILIPNDTSVGTWNSSDRIYTLTTDVSDGLEIVESNLTLDGAGRTVTPTGSDKGVDFYQKSGITIMNLNVTGGGAGISLRFSDGCTVTNNTVSSCNYGIFLAGSNNNTVTGNTVESSVEAGIWLQQNASGNNIMSNTASNNPNGLGIYAQNCTSNNNNNLTSNTVSNNKYGIKLYNCNNISVTGNNISNNDSCEIYLYNSHGNELTGNNISNNDSYAIHLYGSDENELTGNNVSNNHGGIWVQGCNNTIYHNNFIDNTGHAYVSDGCTGNVFNQAAPTGGNFWCNWCPPEHPDDDCDGFVDEPYIFNVNSQDDLPWACQDGWLNQPPVAESPAVVVEYIRDYIEQMDVPEDAEMEMEKAVTDLNKAINEFINDRIDKAFNNIAKAVKHLMKAQEKGAGTQDVIVELVALVQGIAEEAIEDAIETVGADNLHIVKAQEHYEKALGNLADGKYDAAIKKFKNAYREAMKALGE